MNWVRTVSSRPRNYGEQIASESSRPGKNSKRTARAVRLPPRPADAAGLELSALPAGVHRRFGQRVRLRDAHVSADLVLANLVDHQLFRYASPRGVEENRLIEGAILLLEPLVLDNESYGVLAPLLVCRAEFDGNVAHLLRLAPPGNRELKIITLAETPELVDFVVVAGDERAHLAARHLQVFSSGVEIGAHASHLRIHGFHVIGGGFSGQLPMHRGIESRELFRGFI